MKILHTADLHFGKQLHGYSRLAEQAEFVDAFLDLASDERPDLVLLAGDLYDRAVPPRRRSACSLGCSWVSRWS